ncbi:MAG: glycosyltransferase [Dehalococcoidia bacterium]|nr:glycosyltransferase [Dehalococcoidia bacterium]
MTSDRLRILFASAEATPFSKVGGLADVAGSLPQALAARGHDVVLFTPCHKPSGRPGGNDDLSISFQGAIKKFSVVESSLANGARAWQIEDGEYFPRSAVYGEADDLDRYLFFCQAIVEIPKLLDWKPDIVHINDWHTGPVAFALRNYAWEDEFYRGAASIFTIHNLRYRGPDRFLDLIGPAIFYADVITTVSPTYAKEILTPELGEGLHDLLGLRRDDLKGVVNGIDYDEFNPATDSRIASVFDAGGLERRIENKRALQKDLGLDESDQPLAGMVARLSEQKGIDITLEAVASLLEAGSMQFVLLGAGDARYEEEARRLQERFPGKASVTIGFDATLAQRIYAGSDFFLMPSRFEPCGLGQMIAMRYGSIPIARRTGGLADTVPDAREGGLGFVFEEYSAGALRSALSAAVEHYGDREAWADLQRRAMGADFSWGASASEYERIYREAVGRKGA